MQPNKPEGEGEALRRPERRQAMLTHSPSLRGTAASYPTLRRHSPRGLAPHYVKASLAEGHGDVGPLGVLEAVHGAQLREHVQAVGEDEHEQQGGQQSHPDARREEARAVTGIGEVPCDVEALDLEQIRQDISLVYSPVCMLNTYIMFVYNTFLCY